MSSRAHSNRCRPPFGTLDGLHLATLDFLRAQGDPVELASYDNRLIAAAQALSIPLAQL